MTKIILPYSTFHKLNSACVSSSFFNEVWKTQKAQIISDWMNPYQQASSIGFGGGGKQGSNYRN